MAAELREALEEAVQLAQRAGALLLEWREKLVADDVQVKGTRRDLVTAADLASEELILAELARCFPDDGVFAEESGRRDTERGSVWYVDPLDGTTNFVHRLPLFAVSLARVTGGRPDLAVVHVPVLGQTFAAARGGGAACNGERLQVSAQPELADALLATGFPYRRQELEHNNLENFNRLFLRVRGLRRMGAAAVDLAYTAAGWLDAFWELHLEPWDVAAGALLIEEAGGVVDTIEPGGDWLHDANIVAGPAALVARVQEILGSPAPSTAARPSGEPAA